ncbi:Abhydrolase 6 and/or PGAP1 domain containing protein [Asbolus verrucosus]|uniref:sn-1-specific diacylglycerol lipase ABHD11 n=1 Tax=Asbolus verrucosus TaxID=1661398 RepID=A0A482W5Y3_ASBVE|nr:Abhydrolase 6 and/or PGAP1 domain containing protein [Asbolus verrucosus]
MICFRKLCGLKSVVKTNRKKLCTVEAVKLAYASYESTNSPSDLDPAPLIVKHGLFGSKSNWNSLCKVYHNKTNRKVIAVDARNHGDSPHTEQHTYEHLASDLKELLKQLQFKKAAFLGHSMGGRAVMYFALKNPDFVEKLIVADISPVTTSPNLRTMPSLFNVLQSLSMPKNVPMSVARSLTDTQLKRFIADKGLRNFLLTNLVQKLDGSYIWRINIPTLLAHFEDIARFPKTENLKYDGPVLFVGGGASDFIQKSDHPRIVKMFPKAEFRYIEGAGHWLHSEKPSEFLKHTIEFLNKK